MASNAWRSKGPRHAYNLKRGNPYLALTPESLYMNFGAQTRVLMFLRQVLLSELSPKPITFLRKKKNKKSDNANKIINRVKRESIEWWSSLVFSCCDKILTSSGRRLFLWLTLASHNPCLRKGQELQARTQRQEPWREDACWLLLV